MFREERLAKPENDYLSAVTMIEDSQIPVRITEDQVLAEDWALVLVALGLSPSVRRAPGGFVLSVPEPEVQRALAGLAAYELENPSKLPAPNDRAESAPWPAGLAVAAMLLVFFIVTVLWNPSVPWFERGSADAERILRGELWRTVTALTLHADVVHALSNAVGAVVFLGAVYGILGAGLGSGVVLLAGAGGNLANAFLQDWPHVSVGASTAIFGAVGLLGSLGMARRCQKESRRGRAWLPVAAALALLAMLGAGGPRVDVLAHLFGFILGGLLGVLFAFIVPDRPGRGAQWTCGCVALAAIVYCWTLALR